jgi:hypothetical protein
MLNSKAARRVKLFRDAYPELSDVTNTQVLRMMNRDKQVKKYVDSELISRIGEIETEKRVDCYC